MDPQTLFGLVAVTVMLVFYALAERSLSFGLAFALAFLMGSAYGFTKGAWPSIDCGYPINTARAFRKSSVFHRGERLDDQRADERAEEVEPTSGQRCCESITWAPAAGRLVKMAGERPVFLR